MLDQQQKLTLDLQSRLDNKNQELLDLKETPKKAFGVVYLVSCHH